MIFEAIINSLFWIVNLIVSILPTASLPSELTSSISTATGYLAAINNFVPLTTIFSIFAIYLTIEGGIFLYKGIMWLLKRFPTQS